MVLRSTNDRVPVRFLLGRPPSPAAAGNHLRSSSGLTNAAAGFLAGSPGSGGPRVRAGRALRRVSVGVPRRGRSSRPSCGGLGRLSGVSAGSAAMAAPTLTRPRPQSRGRSRARNAASSAAERARAGATPPAGERCAAPRGSRRLPQTVGAHIGDHRLPALPAQEEMPCHPSARHPSIAPGGAKRLATRHNSLPVNHRQIQTVEVELETPEHTTAQPVHDWLRRGAGRVVYSTGGKFDSGLYRKRVRDAARMVKKARRDSFPNV